jgi:hypothetical protein
MSPFLCLLLCMYGWHLVMTTAAKGARRVGYSSHKSETNTYDHRTDNSFGMKLI